MILVDTAIWIDHLHRAEAELDALLESGEALVHPYVFGEIALGRLKERAVVLEQLRALPTPVVAHADEVAVLIESAQLHGRGIGYVDACLLASALVTPATRLWTRDRKLLAVASELECAA